MERIGTVRHIARYPVKSMRGEELDSVGLTLQGLPADRMYAFAREGVYTPFPWFTAREHSPMLRCQPTWDRSGARPALLVETEDGRQFPVASDELREWLTEASGTAIRLHTDHRGNHDVGHVSLITTATIEALAAAGGVAQDHRRFRMNFVIDADEPAFGEREWVGRVLRLGEARLAVQEQDHRCVMITLDPETGLPAPAVLRNAAQLNDAFAGVYLAVLTAGKVAVGDEVMLEA